MNSFVPNWAGYSKNADDRFLAIREPLRQFDRGDADADLLPFPTQAFGRKGRLEQLTGNPHFP